MAPSDRVSVVASVKAALEARGVNLSGPDGAFEITRRVAWWLRGEGAGLLSKTTGNNAHGFAVDIIAYRDGTYVDCLIDSGGANTPAWQVQSGVVDVSRWTAPSDPGDAQPDKPPVPPEPTPAPTPPDDIRGVLLEVLETIGPGVDALEANTNAVLKLSEQLAQLGKGGLRVHF